MDCKKDIEDLIENIDEFKEKYVTYRTNTLRTILVKTLDHIKRKEQECAELKEYHNKCCQDFKKEKQDLINKYNQLSRDFYNGEYCNVDKCKQLQIKTQEYEMLQQLENEEKEIIAELKTEKAKLEAQIGEDTQYYVKEECNLRNIIRNKEKRNIELYKENNQLKAENDELKEKVKELRQGWINCDKERDLQEANSGFGQRVINRYKQTLSSIKNIAEEDFNHTCWETYAGQLEQILQKISEVENAR